jgi:UDP-N-acetylmuramate dehydrogenase
MKQEIERAKLESAGFRGRLFFGEPLSRYTTMRVGGSADALLCPGGPEDLALALRFCARNGIRLTPLGRGSNVIVGDTGLNGLTLLLSALDGIRSEGDGLLRAFAGASLRSLSLFALEKGLSGLEFAEGIPGSVGGAVWMNAGAYDGEIAGVLEGVSALDAQGGALALTNAGCGFGYRHSSLMDLGLLVVEASFRLKPGDPVAIKGRMEELRALRREKQPLEIPSAGSFFKRPPGHFAAKLIEEAGLKGLRLGGAQISEKHAGFLVNAGGATAADIRALMERVQGEVFARFGVRLEPEVRFLEREE